MFYPESAMLSAREDVQPTGFFLLSAMQGGFSRASISVVALSQEQCRCCIIYLLNRERCC